jgi:uncharacterized phage protein (TIGR01671 family)
MREILFRAKDYRTGQWVYGIYFKNPVSRFNEGAYYPQIIPEIHGVHDTIERCSIVEDTLGQYTGLIDKNGVKIFEGDILSSDKYPYFSDGNQNYFAEIVWFDNCPAFGLYTFKSPKSVVRGVAEGSEFIEDDLSDMEVIGNIHDNPELLGGDDNCN